MDASTGAGCSPARRVDHSGIELVGRYLIILIGIPMNLPRNALWFGHGLCDGDDQRWSVPLRAVRAST
jgi:hypothetical protein